ADCGGTKRSGGVGRAGGGEQHAAQLAEGAARRQTRRAGQQAGQRRADGAGAAARGAGANEDGARHRKKSCGVLREGVEVKYAFIESKRYAWPISLLCEQLEVSA